MRSDLKDLSLLLDSRVPLLVIESCEEPRVLEMITRLAVKRTMPMYTWSVTEGLCRLGFGSDPEPDTESRDPAGVLRLIKSSAEPGIYVLCDFHPYIKDDPLNVRLLREISMQHHRLEHTVVLLSHRADLPAELRRYSARFEISMPSEEQLANLVREEASNWSKSQSGQPVRSNSETFKKLVSSLRGMSIQDARQLVRGAIWDDGAIQESDLPELNKAKFALMDMEGVLSFEYDTASFSEVGGLDKLKDWLGQRADAFQADSTKDLDPPKGIMLLGIQGSGKGRLDEIFFVDLPDFDVRMDIFKIHLQKRNQQPDHFDLQRLAKLTEGFSGAEIEQAIVSALYSVSAMDEVLSMPLLESTISDSSPLSVVMFETIHALREWAKDRCVFAD